MKIDKDKHQLVVEDILEDVSTEELREELPGKEGKERPHLKGTKNR